MNPRHGAFTLTELLVALTVIGILCALLLPALSRSQGAARSASCATQMRQLHLAFAGYAADHDDRLPPYQNAISGFQLLEGVSFTVPMEPERLVAALEPYHRSDDLWFCASDPHARARGGAGGGRSHAHSSYITNPALGKAFTLGFGVGMDGPDPLFDLASGLFGGAGGAAGTLLLTEDVSTSPGPGLPPAYTHRGRLNVLFFDGHVRPMRWQDVPL